MIALVANPIAGGGRAARRLPTVQAAFAAVEARAPRYTEGPGDEARLVRAALEAGATTIAVLGGDGTWSKCAAALVDAGGADRCRLAFLAGGTGNDFAKSLDAPEHDAEAMALLCAAPNTERRVDLMRIDRGWCLNVAGFGFDVAVLEAMTRPQLLTGRARYAGAAVTRLHAYKGTEVSLDGGASWRTTLLLALANGGSFGGSFRIAPEARVDDGALELVSVGDVGLGARLGLFARVMAGRHRGAAGVEMTRTASLALTFRAPPVFQVDGELRQASAAVVEAECVPGALRVVTRFPRR